MANSIPLKALFNPDGSVKTLAEFSITDTVPVANGGTGTSTLGTVVGGGGITVTDGVGAVINSFSVSLDSSTVVVPGESIQGGIIDGGSFS